MPADFLMLQMEWREAIEEASAASDIDALDNLLSETRKTARQLQQQLHALLDQPDAIAAAAETVRKLSFIDKVQADIGHAINKLQDA
jgi:molecular chaperone HscB